MFLPKQSELRRALSLIEVLSAVAILSVLTALLVPTFDGIVTKANQSTAASDLRQIHVAVGQFANDNDGWLPGPVFSAAASGFRKNDRKFARYVAPYLMSEDFASASTSQEFRLPQLEPREYYRQKVKPSNARALAYKISTIDLTDPDFDHPFGDSNTGEAPKKLAAVPDPSRNRMLWDLDLKNQEDNPGWKGDLPNEPLYGNTRLVLYFDGHIEHEPVETEETP